MNRFYIYAHTKTTDNSVFYVGRGTGSRCVNKRNRNPHWNNIVAKHGFFSEIIEDNLTSDKANIREKFWINEFRIAGNKLCNLTDGGGGLSGRARPEAEKESIRNALIGIKKPEIVRQKMLGNKNALGMSHSDEAKIKVSIAQKDKPKSEEHKQKLSEALKGRPLSPEHRAKVVAALLARKAKRNMEI
jgi:hypothetical protein